MVVLRVRERMARKRPKGWMALGWACFECAATGRTEHAPTSECYPDDVVRRETFTAGGGHGWKISTLVAPRARPAPWKIVVITGAPSWAEYWAPALAILPKDREMVVVDRPGFANSEPAEPVTDIRVQAQALAPSLSCASCSALRQPRREMRSRSSASGWRRSVRPVAA